MPAGADLVVNLARGSFLERVNTGLSSENFARLYARGGICHKSRRGPRCCNAGRASAATLRSNSEYRDLSLFPCRRDARDGIGRAIPVRNGIDVAK